MIEELFLHLIDKFPPYIKENIVIQGRDTNSTLLFDNITGIYDLKHRRTIIIYQYDNQAFYSASFSKLTIPSDPDSIKILTKHIREYLSYYWYF